MRKPHFTCLRHIIQFASFMREIAVQSNRKMHRRWMALKLHRPKPFHSIYQGCKGILSSFKMSFHSIYCGTQFLANTSNPEREYEMSDTRTLKQVFNSQMAAAHATIEVGGDTALVLDHCEKKRRENHRETEKMVLVGKG